VDLAFPALGVVHVAVFGRHVHVAEHREARMPLQFLAQPGRQRFVPAQLVRIFIRARRLAVGRIKTHHAHIANGGTDDALRIIGEVGDAMLHLAGHRAREDGNAVVGLLAAVHRLVTRGLQLGRGEIRILRLGFLQAHRIGLGASQPVEEVGKADLERVDVPGREPERHI
jgi:hypothetical protein